MSEKSDAATAATPAKKSSFSDLGPRVASAIVLVGAAGLTLWLGGEPFALFWIVAGYALNWEWQRLIGGGRRLARVIAGGVAVALMAGFARLHLMELGLLATLIAAGAAAWLVGAERRLWAFFGVIYAALPTAAVCLLRDSPEFGLLAIAWLFGVVWGTDIFAYFGGRIIGGPKLWPRVSAGKTWSGTLTGLVLGAALGVAAAAFFGGGRIALVPVFALGLLVSAVSQIGDLIESSIKRHYGVKDSSNLIPGHGGVMDRLDGFIFAVVLAAAIGALRGGESPAAGLFVW